MTEHTYGKRVKAALEAAGAFVVKYRPGNGQRAGMPDLYVAHDSWVGWVELKYAGRRVTPLQLAISRKLKARGVSCFVLRGPENVIETFDGAILFDEPLQLAALPSVLAKLKDHA
jgi:hypothetical protein